MPDQPPGIALTRLNVQRLGEVDIEHVRTHLFDLAGRSQGQDLHLDLSPLEYLTSTGLDLFLDLHKEVRSSGGRLSLLNVGEPLYELFSVTRLDAVFDVRRQGHSGTSA
jgi:anti-anti-sigma factor